MYVNHRKRKLAVAIRLTLLAAAAVSLEAQMPGTGGGSGASSRATPLPASGRQASTGAVQAQQTPGPGSGVATVSSSVQIGGNFAGSVPAAQSGTGPITLTLSDALKLGLAANLGTVSAGNEARAARAGRLQALSALLPNISANASETVTQVNLAAYGFQFKVPPGFPLSIPSVVGPFEYSSLQGSLNQTVFDAVERRNWKASKETERAANLSAKDARELVVLAVGGSYLQTLAAAARVDSQRAQVANAQAIYNQAVTRKEAGTNARIDVVRSRVELQTEQQRLSSLEADLRKQKIALARVIGVPLDREIVLAEPLRYQETAIPETQAAIAQAEQGRADLRAAEAQLHAAELALAAAHAERYPSASINGYYGALGPTPTSAHGVFAVTGAINVPIWQGGRIKGDIEEAEATVQQRKAELADQRARVEEDVRNALIELETAAGQVKLAESNRAYANETLNEARDRFAAGVATTVEVVQAQEQVAGAESDYISSLFSFDLARLSLARATGQAEADLPDLLKEKR
ncbi:MAG TPA: TolC family protein [Bryobacteraceae bacterium]|jgi:outer membrane protein TolC|nr:TolC family protein [Bryobacteraceae bacterium]